MGGLILFPHQFEAFLFLWEIHSGLLCCFCVGIFFFPESNVQGLAFPHHVTRVQQKVQNGVKTVL